MASAGGTDNQGRAAQEAAAITVDFTSQPAGIHWVCLLDVEFIAVAATIPSGWPIASVNSLAGTLIWLADSRGCGP